MATLEGKKKARAAVQAMFDRYKVLAAQRPEDHVVSRCMPELQRSLLTKAGL
jgi:hypothetical protein